MTKLEAAKAAHAKAWRAWARRPENKIMFILLKAYNRMGRETDKTPEHKALRIAAAHAAREAKKARKNGR